MRLSDENLRGRTIIGADGKVIGEVGTLFLDSTSFRVESFQVKLDKPIAELLGTPHSLFRPGVIEVPVSLVQSVGDTLVLNVAVEGLRQVLPVDTEAPGLH
jgi:sporulation protein YlmC with PRC-barrel domain